LFCFVVLGRNLKRQKRSSLLTHGKDPEYIRDL
jgi:hypothetical protein